ncbi:silent information regulator family protein [Reticulomyxa filosa]|uniref:Silent information regulator family protein n=1 Tax=Reticulomyxa filosa TaxID=46433 RepID=X6NKB2_RETFI|nr:silent information regulator family protein [Reticulomyxa filosa]|eukprot:ETO26348.1 silent information regulator family protein [Reticulomyxa filosa]
MQYKRPEKELTNAVDNSLAADLTVVLGSSMRVYPACNLPSYSYSREAGPGSFVLVNLQKTPYDEFCEADPSGSGRPKGLRVFSKIDDFMKLVMKELKLEVTQFELDSFIEECKKSLKGVKNDPDFKVPETTE